MKKIIKGCTAVLSVVLSAVLILGVFVAKNFPDSYQVTKNSGLELRHQLPVTAKTENGGDMIEAGSLNTSNENYQANLMLFNMIPVKSVNIQLVQETKVIPCGNPFGVKIFTEGVVVVGMTDVKTEKGTVNPAKEAGLKTGDVILEIDDTKVNSNEEVSSIISGCNGKAMELSVQRSNVVFETNLVPVKSSTDGTYKAGLWVRDSSAGIGTLTFYDPTTKSFAGLGHGICDIDTGEILPLLSGDIVKANISGVVKGEKGSPGELRGYFTDSKPIGNLEANVSGGVYGYMEQNPSALKPVTVAMKQQVKAGKAQVLTTIDGVTPEYYDIEIESVNYDENALTKNMVIRITDERLLEKTGGIVQGMSGSPILQDGMLVGAVTHVFVNEPQKGYGIFAENMLAVSKTISNSYRDKAS